jgi:hypothetical protein
MSARESNAASLACLIASAVALGHALQIANGFYDDAALVWLTAALALCVAGVLAPGLLLRGVPLAPGLLSRGVPLAPGLLSRGFPLAPGLLSRGFPKEELWLRLAIAAGIGWQVASLLDALPGMYLQEHADLGLFKAGVIVEAALIAYGAARFRGSDSVWFPALLVVHAAVGIWMLHASPSPRIDVVVVHREAFDALWRGESPYGITFENIYGAGSGFYNPQAVAGNRVLFGYPYPPLSLLLALPGYVVTGDYRYSELAAWVASAAFIGYARPAILAKLAAALLLTQPRGFFVLEQGWTEPIAVLMLAVTIFGMSRHRAVTAWAGGLLIVTKQYLALAVPLLWRFAARRRGAAGFLARAGIAAAAVTLPFVLWHPRAFVDSVLLLQTREPLRIDSLSYLSWAARHDLGGGSFVWAIAAGSVALAAGALLTPNTPAGFALSLALSSFAAFAFGSKAFCNYYFFVVGALCCAIAIQGPFEGPFEGLTHSGHRSMMGEEKTNDSPPPGPL